MAVTLVCGPPCSGKSTYVAGRAQPGDVVVDYDQIARQLGSPSEHNHAYRFHKPTERVITELLGQIASGRHENAWVIRSLPDSAQRRQLASHLRAEVVIVDAPDELLAERARSRGNVVKTVAAIASWRRASGIPSPTRLTQPQTQTPGGTPSPGGLSGTAKEGSPMCSDQSTSTGAERPLQSHGRSERVSGVESGF